MVLRAFFNLSDSKILWPIFNITNNCVTYWQENTSTANFFWNFPGAVIQVCKNIKAVWRAKHSESIYNCFRQNTYALVGQILGTEVSVSNKGSRFLVIPTFLLTFSIKTPTKGISFWVGKNNYNDSIFLLWLLWLGETWQLH